MLDGASHRHITETEAYLLVEVASGSISEVAEIYRTLAFLCIKKQLRRVLVKAADDDAAGEHALRDAFTTMLLAGIPPDFRLALVAATQRVEARYRSVQHDLSLASVATKIFDNESDAAYWLNGSGRLGARAAA